MTQKIYFVHTVHEGYSTEYDSDGETWGWIDNRRAFKDIEEAKKSTHRTWWPIAEIENREGPMMRTDYERVVEKHIDDTLNPYDEYEDVHDELFEIDLN